MKAAVCLARTPAQGRGNQRQGKKRWETTKDTKQAWKQTGGASDFRQHAQGTVNPAFGLNTSCGQRMARWSDTNRPEGGSGRPKPGWGRSGRSLGVDAPEGTANEKQRAEKISKVWKGEGWKRSGGRGAHQSVRPKSVEDRTRFTLRRTLQNEDYERKFQSREVTTNSTWTGQCGSQGPKQKGKKKNREFSFLSQCCGGGGATAEKITSP